MSQCVEKDFFLFRLYTHTHTLLLSIGDVLCRLDYSTFFQTRFVCYIVCICTVVTFVRDIDTYTNENEEVEEEKDCSCVCVCIYLTI
jgi:hypothetical protein